MGKWSTVKKSAIPERMAEYEYVELTTLVGKTLVVCDYEVFEGNSDKYDDESKMGIHIVFELEDKERVRVCTHARALVSMFADGDKDLIAGLIEDRETCTVKEQWNKNHTRRYLTLE